MSQKRAFAYRVLAGRLRVALARGDYANGRQLPTEAELGAAYGLGRQTVRRAIQELAAEGLIYRVRGRGTFSTGAAPGSGHTQSFGSVEDLFSYDLATTIETIIPLHRQTDAEVAHRLGLDSDEVTVGLVRRDHDGVPLCATYIFLPPALGSRLVDQGFMTTVGEVSSTTAISAIDEIAAHPISGAEQTVTAVPMPADLAELVELAPDVPVLQRERLYYDTGAAPVELAISYFNPQRYDYRLHLSRTIPLQMDSPYT